MINHLINTAVLVSPSPRYSEKDIKQKRLDVKARKRLNVSWLAGAELERILARTLLALVERLTFPPSFTAMTLKKTCWSARNCFEAQLSSSLLCGGSGSRLQPEPPQVQARRSWVTRGTLGEELRSSLRSVLFGE